MSLQNILLHKEKIVFNINFVCMHIFMYIRVVLSRKTLEFNIALVLHNWGWWVNILFYFFSKIL